MRISSFLWCQGLAFNAGARILTYLAFYVLSGAQVHELAPATKLEMLSLGPLGLLVSFLAYASFVGLMVLLLRHLQKDPEIGTEFINKCSLVISSIFLFLCLSDFAFDVNSWLVILHLRLV